MSHRGERSICVFLDCGQKVHSETVNGRSIVCTILFGECTTELE